MRLIHKPSQTVLASHLEIADTPFSRMKGLLGRASLPLGHALWIVPCGSIHTCFMRFALDVVFLDRERRVVKIVRDLPPFRFSFSWSAHSVIEWRAGSLEKFSLRRGDPLIFEGA
ncbi:MAG: DUF192 domain-containing protein [Planctomycetota bacterium]|nr:MAG: DUF192 domain-containing protein [Planctomycetota bacterium]